MFTLKEKVINKTIERTPQKHYNADLTKTGSIIALSVRTVGLAVGLRIRGIITPTHELAEPRDSNTDWSDAKLAYSTSPNATTTRDGSYPQRVNGRCEPRYTSYHVDDDGVYGKWIRLSRPALDKSICFDKWKGIDKGLDSVI